MLMSPAAHHRWSIASRALAAVVGGYALVTLFILALSLLLPMIGIAQAPALLGTSIASFLIWTAIIMAVFHARSATQAWAWLTVVAAPLCLAILLLPGATA